MTDPNSSMPLYLQIVSHLGNRIISGELKPGDKLLTEPELCKEYGVSRVTLRHAIAALVEKGFLVSRQGKGTFVASSAFLSNPTRFHSFTASSMAETKITETRIIRTERLRAGGEAMLIPGVAATDEFVCVMRLRISDGEPVIVEYDYFKTGTPAEKASTYNLAAHSLYQTLEDRLGIGLHAFEEQLRIQPATKEHAELLGVPEGKALLGIFETVTDPDGSIVYYNDQVINLDRHQYVLHYTK